MTEEQRELMEFLAASRDQMMDQVAAGFLDLKQDIQEVKVSDGCLSSNKPKYFSNQHYFIIITLSVYQNTTQRLCELFYMQTCTLWVILNFKQYAVRVDILKI